MKFFRIPLLFAALSLTSGCNLLVLHPFGDVAMEEGKLVVIATLMMLVIIVPVIFLTILFAWRYRQSNKKADYDPEWDHSMKLELVIWALPLLIIICLGAVTWVSTHLLDPYRTLARISPEHQITNSDKPLEVEVVALDWKWLFIYPEYNIATVNEMAAPVNRPISFHITSSSVMNSFYIPALAGQVYAMADMETPMHAVINQPGSYQGFSANYSGAGFSGMHFTFLGMTDSDFIAWIAKVKAGSGLLGRASYLELAKPTENVPVHYYPAVDSELYHAILNNCVTPGTICMDHMMTMNP